jgi:hypothetical protein
MVLIVVLAILFFYLIFFPNKEENQILNQKYISHDVFMNSFKTKNEILREFGIPDIKKEQDEFEEWIYKKDKKIIRKKISNENIQNLTVAGGLMLKNKYPIGGMNNLSSNNEEENEVIKEEYKIVKFIILNNKVIKWSTEGLDYGKMIEIKKTKK